MNSPKLGFSSAVNGVRQLVRSAGFDLQRYDPTRLGVIPARDIELFLRAETSPLLLDVGANLGQTVDALKEVLPNARIHSFEPSPTTHAQLTAHCRKYAGVQTWNCGIGSQNGTLPFLENEHADMSSFLAPGSTAWGRVLKETQIEVITLDAFTKQHGIDFVHLLKTDTQGYDFEVLKGAETLMRQNRIGLIHCEFVFSDMYKGLPPVHEILRFLAERNFSLVTFYRLHYQHHLASWTDGLFINQAFHAAFQKRTGNSPAAVP